MLFESRWQETVTWKYVAYYMSPMNCLRTAFKVPMQSLCLFQEQCELQQLQHCLGTMTLCISPCISFSLGFHFVVFLKKDKILFALVETLIIQ